MTVCIGAICNWFNQPMIVAASDRMLTAGDIEFEPPQTKIVQLTTHSSALISGDAAPQSAICASTVEQLRKRPTINVDEIASMYAEEFAKYRRQLAERRFLKPLGLTLDEFIAKQREMAPELVRSIRYDLQQEAALDVSAIIAGIDANGAHIYVVSDPGRTACHDSVGFAAIGVGEWHAQSQFMFARYIKSWPLPEAALLTYTAKKRAEVAPGVGTETDMIIIGPGANPIAYIPEPMLTELDTIYKAMVTQHEQATLGAHKNVSEYVKKLVDQGTPKPTDPRAEERSS